MKVFLIILLILLLLTVLLCLSSAVASVRYWDGAFEWNVKYLGIVLAAGAAVGYFAYCAIQVI